LVKRESYASERFGFLELHFLSLLFYFCLFILNQNSWGLILTKSNLKLREVKTLHRLLLAIASQCSVVTVESVKAILLLTCFRHGL
jgi:hypothetical protein